MSKKPTDEELEAFYKAVSGTKRLINDKIPLAHNTTTRLKTPQTRTLKSLVIADNPELEALNSETPVAFKQVSISHKILRNLRKGQYTIDATLDLHGMNVNEAKIAVDQFLQHCIQTDFRIVLIIHGKGRRNQVPILKNKLNQWLRSTHLVLAFCSATSSHGSRGAMYVLLKRATEENILE